MEKCYSLSVRQDVFNTPKLKDIWMGSVISDGMGRCTNRRCRRPRVGGRIKVDVFLIGLQFHATLCL